MTRDYKRRTARRRKKSQPASGFAWLLSGFALGLGVAIAVYWVTRPPIGDRAPGEPVPMAAEPQSATEPPTRKTPSPDPEASRFDFYKMLPNSEVIVPDVDEASPAAARRPRAKSSGAYMLQAGSFQQMRDADRRKAEIALLGIESRIRSVTIGENQVWHRVLIGPDSDLDEMLRYRTRLREADVDVLLIEVAE